MTSKILSNIELVGDSEYYIDSLHAVLTSAGLYEGPKYLLSGMTGTGFKLISHKRIIPPSRYMYHLDIDSWKAIDRLGIYNEVFCGFKTSPTFELYQKKAIERIKESIDKGVGALFWNPTNGFGVINGYDEEDKVFFYLDRFKKGNQILLYTNLGKIRASFWVCQVIGEKIDKDIRDIYLDSLECAVDEWENSDNVPVFSKNEYVSGRLAYDYMIKALESDNFSERGAFNTIRFAIITKEYIAKYLEEVIKEFPKLLQTSVKYHSLNEVFEKIKDIISKMYTGTKVTDRRYLPKLVDYLREGKRIEESAIGEVKVFLWELLNNRQIDSYDVKKFI